MKHFFHERISIFCIFHPQQRYFFFCELYRHNTEYAYCHMNKLRYYSSSSHLPHILDSETLSSTFSGHLATLDKWTSKCCTCSSSWPWHSSLFSVFFFFFLCHFHLWPGWGAHRGFDNAPSSRVVRSTTTATICKQVFWICSEHFFILESQ